MSLKAKEITIAVLSVAIVVVLGFVVMKEKEHASGERIVKPKPDSAGCVKCHGEEDANGGRGRDPGVVAHWEASMHAEQGVGCADCHGLPPAGSGEDLTNPRYVVETVWDKESGIKTVSLVTESSGPIERPDIWDHEGMEIIVDVSPRTCARKRSSS